MPGTFFGDTPVPVLLSVYITGIYKVPTSEEVEFTTDLRRSKHICYYLEGA